MSKPSVVMLLENNAYPRDVRPRREAESLTAAGYGVTVLAPRDPSEPRREVVNGVSVRRFRLPKPRAGRRSLLVEYLVANVQLFVRGILELLKGAKVVHLHNPPDTFFPVAWAAHLLGRRVVVDIHDLAPELSIEKFGEGRLTSALLRLERMSVRSADQILTVNESLRELLAARTGVPVERISVLRNVPPREAIPASTAARGGQLRDPRLLFLGSIESQDGVDALPELVQLLIDDYGLTGTTLTVIGDGSGRSAVQTETHRRDLDDRVNFLGYVRHDDLAPLLADADVCIEPAPRGPLNDRCSMVKVAEYMAAGRPVVCFPLPEVVRMAEDAALYAETGSVRELACLVARLASDEQLRTALGRRGRDRALELTWETSADHLLAAYELALASRGAAREARRP